MYIHMYTQCEGMDGRETTHNPCCPGKMGSMSLNSDSSTDLPQGFRGGQKSLAQLKRREAWDEPPAKLKG